jgi:hypothetical protein
MKLSQTRALAAAALLGVAGAAGAQTNSTAPNPALSTPPNAGAGPSSSIGPSSAQGGPAIPGTSLGTTGVPNNANAAPAQTEGTARCALLSGMEKDRCLRDAPPAAAPTDAGSADRVGPGSTGMGSGR